MTESVKNIGEPALEFAERIVLPRGKPEALQPIVARVDALARQNRSTVSVILSGVNINVGKSYVLGAVMREMLVRDIPYTHTGNIRSYAAYRDMLEEVLEGSKRAQGGTVTPVLFFEAEAAISMPTAEEARWYRETQRELLADASGGSRDLDVWVTIESPAWPFLCPYPVGDFIIQNEGAKAK